MLSLLISICSIFVTIFFVIGTHESAHFIAARLLGVKVLRFSIGFGKVLLRKRDKRGTEYVISLVPLGGYVKMLDENEGEVAPQELPHAYNRQPFYKKFLIVIAGPISNLLCAAILYWFIFMIGFVTVKPIIGVVKPNSIAAAADLHPRQVILKIDKKDVGTWMNVIFYLLFHVGDRDQINITATHLLTHQETTHQLDLTHWRMDELKPAPLESLGIIPYEPPIPLVIGEIAVDSPAAKSSLKLGDEIIAVDKTPIKNWEQLITFIQQHQNQPTEFTIKRNEKTLTIPVTIGVERNILFERSGYLGIAPNFFAAA